MTRPKPEGYFEKLYMPLPLQPRKKVPLLSPTVSPAGADAINGNRPRRAELVKKPAEQTGQEPDRTEQVMVREEKPPPASAAKREKVEIVKTASLSGTELKVRQIQEHVAAKYGFTVEQLLSDLQADRLATARHIAMWVSRRLLGLPSSKITLQFGRRSPGTVDNALSKVDRLKRSSYSMQEQLERLCREIQHRWTES